MSCFGEGGESQGMNVSCLSWASQNSAVIPIFWTWIQSTFYLAFTDGPRDGPQAKGSSHQCRETWLQDSTQEELAGPTAAPRAPPILLPLLSFRSLQRPRKSRATEGGGGHGIR